MASSVRGASWKHQNDVRRVEVSTEVMTSEATFPAVLDDLGMWVELSYELGCTDGLPVHPPLRDVVDALVAGTGRDRDEVIAVIPPREGCATVEVIAANAAMAGARPEHMPVIVAALDAMGAPEHNLRGVAVTTHPAWPLVIVSGDEVERLGLATTESVFSGGGNRANVAIGRTIKLVVWNVGAALPGEPVKEVFGHPGRLGGYCIAETSESPWEPIHRARGLDAASGVTVFACESPHSVAMWGCDDEPEHRLGQAADALTIRGSNNTHTMGEVLVVMSPSEARHLAEHGYSRHDVQRTLFQLARRRIGDIRPRGPLRPDNSPEHFSTFWPDWVDQSDDDTLVPVVASPEAIHVVVAGADSIPWMAVCPGWGHLGGFAVTRPLPSPVPMTEEVPS